MTKFFNRYHTSKAAEETGTWIPLGDDMHVKARRWTSTHAKETRLRLEAPYKALKKVGAELSTEDNEEILTLQMAESLIVDWKGVTLPISFAEEAGISTVNAVDGVVDVPFTPENAKKVFAILPDFKFELSRVLFDRDTFKVHVTEVDAKNS